MSGQTKRQIGLIVVTTSATINIGLTTCKYVKRLGSVDNVHGYIPEYGVHTIM